MAGVHLHVPRHVRLALEGQGNPQFYGPLARGLRRRGAEVVLRPSDEDSWRAIPEGGEAGVFHVVHNGRIRAPGVLNAAIAYLDRWWQLDPAGVLGRSSIASEAWDRAATDRRAAMDFLSALRRRYVLPRRSRYDQPAGVVPAPEGSVAVFLQGRSPLTEMARRFPTAAMIRAVAMGSGGRPVRVKPHPQRSHPDELAAISHLAAEGHDVALYEGNVHDLLARCAATVSISSACSFEGFLHRKPAILYGRSDFHHHAFAVPDDTPEGFAATLEKALTTRQSHARYVHWYLRGHCLNADDPRLMRRILGRMRAAGWDAGWLGTTTEGV